MCNTRCALANLVGSLVVTEGPTAEPVPSPAPVLVASPKRRGIAIFLGLLVGLPALVIGVDLVVAFAESPVTWADMDWNSDGRTSLAELARSLDVGVRPTSPDVRACREFFSLKDGLPMRVQCP
jgi:hypothetical protein